MKSFDSNKQNRVKGIRSKFTRLLSNKLTFDLATYLPMFGQVGALISIESDHKRRDNGEIKQQQKCR